MQDDVVREAMQNLADEMSKTNKAFEKQDKAENETHYQLSKAWADELRHYVNKVHFGETWVNDLVTVDVKVEGVKW